MMTALIGICWMAANILVVMLLRPRDGYNERPIV